MSRIKDPLDDLSDHLSIEIKLKVRRTLLRQPGFTVKSSDLRPSNRLDLSSYLKEIDVPTLISIGNTCTEEVSILETIINMGLAITSKTIHSNEPP